MGAKIGQYSLSRDINDLYNYSNDNIEIYKGKFNEQRGIIIKIKNMKVNNVKKKLDSNPFKNILKENDNFIQSIDYSFLNNNSLISFYYFKDRKKYQSFYSFFQKRNFYYLNCYQMKNIIIQLNEIIKIIYYNKLPFPFFNIYHFYYDINNNKIKYLYFTFYEKNFSNYDFYENFIDNISIKNIEDIIQKKHYINYNIGNFIYNLLFRESPNYNIEINRRKNKFHKLIIPDYKIIDCDKNLFDLLHFLLDFEENDDNINDNLNLIIEEEKNLKLYFSHHYFNENLPNEININHQSKQYFFNKLNDNEIPNEGKIIKNIYKCLEKEIRYQNFKFLNNNFSIVIKNHIIQVYNPKCVNIYNISEIKEGNYSNFRLFDLNNDYIILYHSNSGLLHFILIKERYYNYFSYEIPINLKNENIQIYKEEKNKKRKKNNKKNNETLNNSINSLLVDIDNSDYDEEELQDYKIHISLLTSSNKLLIKRLIKPKYFLNDIIFILDLNDLNKNISNPKIQLMSIIEIGYLSNNSIVENTKINEIIMNDEYNIYFYDSNTFEKKFVLNFKNKNVIYDIYKISDEIFIIKYDYLIYILKNHQIIGTYYTPGNIFISCNFVCLKKNLILLILNKNHSFEKDEEEEEKENQNIGIVIFDNYYYYNDDSITTLLEIKENNYIIKHCVNNNNIDDKKFLYFEKINDNVIFRTYLYKKNKTNLDIKFYSLEEKN